VPWGGYSWSQGEGRIKTPGVAKRGEGAFLKGRRGDYRDREGTRERGHRVKSPFRDFNLANEGPSFTFEVRRKERTCASCLKKNPVPGKKGKRGVPKQEIVSRMRAISRSVHKAEPRALFLKKNPPPLLFLMRPVEGRRKVRGLRKPGFNNSAGKKSGEKNQRTTC